MVLARTPNRRHLMARGVGAKSVEAGRRWLGDHRSMHVRIEHSRSMFGLNTTGPHGAEDVGQETNKISIECRRNIERTRAEV